MGCIVGVPVAPRSETEEITEESHLQVIGGKIDTLADALMLRATPGRVQDRYEVYNTSLGEYWRPPGHSLVFKTAMATSNRTTGRCFAHCECACIQL